MSSSDSTTLTVESTATFASDVTIAKTSPGSNITGSNQNIIFRTDAAGARRMDLQIYDGLAYLGARTSAAHKIYTTDAGNTATFWQGGGKTHNLSRVRCGRATCD
jgi:hypothetical protein